MSGSCGWNISLVPPFCSSFHPWNITLTAVQTFVGITKLILISERMNDKKKISIKSEENYFNFRRRKKLSCQSVFFPPMSTLGSSRCASFKSNSWWERRTTVAADVAADSSSAWNPMGGGDGGRCTVKRRRGQIRFQKWLSWPIFQQHSSNIYFATNIKTLLNDHE